MAQRTIRVNIVDSATGNTNRNAISTDYNGNNIPADGFLRNNYSSRSYTHIGTAPYDYISPYGGFAAFAFEDIDLSPLEGRPIISCTLNFNIVANGYWRGTGNSTGGYGNYIFQNGYRPALFLAINIGYYGIPFNSQTTSNSQSIQSSTIGIKAIDYPATTGNVQTSLDFASALNIINNGLNLRPYGNVTENVGNVVYTWGSTNFSGINTAAPPYIDIVYDDTGVPGVATAYSPNEEIVNNDSSITFRWNFVQPFGYPQTNFDLQYNNGTTWINLANAVASSLTEFTIPPNTLPNNITNGQVQWRVRSYSENGTVVSSWSNIATFSLRSGAPPPVITFVSYTPMFTVNWTSTVQTGYRVIINKQDENGNYILYHDTGEIYGIERSFTYKYLPEGEYQLQVAIGNSFGLWSSYASQTFGVINTPTGIIQLTSKTNCKNYIILSWTTETVFERFFVIRNGFPIAVLDNSIRSYEDFNAGGKNIYQIRGIIDPNYTDSNTSTETVRLKNSAQLNLYNTNNTITLKKRRNARPLHTETKGVNASIQHYEGRILPVVYTNPQQTNVHTFEFSLHNNNDYCKTWDDYEKLLTFNNKIVVYKDCKGHRVVGNLELGTIYHDVSIDVRFTITEVDVGEFLNYVDY